LFPSPAGSTHWQQVFCNKTFQRRPRSLLVGQYVHTNTCSDACTHKNTGRAKNSPVYVLQPQRDGRASADRGKSVVGRHRAMVRVTRSSTERPTAPTEGGQWTHFCLAARRIMSAANDAHAVPGPLASERTQRALTPVRNVMTGLMEVPRRSPCRCQLYYIPLCSQAPSATEICAVAIFCGCSLF